MSDDLMIAGLIAIFFILWTLMAGSKVRPALKLAEELGEFGPTSSEMIRLGVPSALQLLNKIVAAGGLLFFTAVFLTEKKVGFGALLMCFAMVAVFYFFFHLFTYTTGGACMLMAQKTFQQCPKFALPLTLLAAFLAPLVTFALSGSLASLELRRKKEAEDYRNRV